MRFGFWHNLQDTSKSRDYGELLDEMRELANGIDEAGGTAHLLRAQSLNASQEEDFRALFDRNDDYMAFVASLSAAREPLLVR